MLYELELKNNNNEKDLWCCQKRKKILFKKIKKQKQKTKKQKTKKIKNKKTNKTKN